MNTYFGLLAQFGKAEIPLEEICPMFGYSPQEAKRRAALRNLPIPVYRAGSQKSPWLVSVADLAKYLDEQKEKARTEWEKVRS